MPALNEEQSIAHVLDELNNTARLHQVVVADNASTDRTAEVARGRGATVVTVPRQGYGSACLGAIEAAQDTDLLLFMDADGAQNPADIPDLIDPIIKGEADLVIGSRVLGQTEKGALLYQARFGNALATSLIKLFWGFSYTDLGPFRAISYQAYQSLGMKDLDFGWTVEMQIKALKRQLRIQEVPVNHRARLSGKSKISGTLKGTVLAGWKILSTIFYYGLIKP